MRFPFFYLDVNKFIIRERRLPGKDYERSIELYRLKLFPPKYIFSTIVTTHFNWHFVEQELALPFFSEGISNTSVSRT